MPTVPLHLAAPESVAVCELSVMPLTVAEQTDSLQQYSGPLQIHQAAQMKPGGP